MNETTNVVQSYFSERRTQALAERSRVVDLRTIYGLVLILQRDIGVKSVHGQPGQHLETPAPVALIGCPVMSDAITQHSNNRVEVHLSSG
jgi:hypothetical protein